MSGASDTAHPGAKQAIGNHAARPPRLNIDWITRPLFGFVLAGIAVAATFRGGFAFATLLSLGCAGAIREWHRLFTRRDFLLPTVITILAMIGALVWQLEIPALKMPLSRYWPYGVLVVGSLCNLLLGASRRQWPFAHAAGPIYIGGSDFTKHGWVAEVLRHWLVLPKNTYEIPNYQIGNYAFVLLIAVVLALTIVRGWRRYVLLVPAIWGTVFVWENRLIEESPTTRPLFLGVILIVLMATRPEGLFGKPRVEVV